MSRSIARVPSPVRTRLLGVLVGALVVVGTAVPAPVRGDVCERAPVWAVADSLPVPNASFGATVYGGHIYMAGGSTGGAYRNTVYAAPIDSGTGDIGQWTEQPSLPRPIVNPAVFGWGGYLYVAGGYHAVDGGLREVYSVPIQPDGSLGTWVRQPDLAVKHIGKHSHFVRSDKVYLVSWSDPPYYPVVQAADLNFDGSLGPWTVLDTLQTQRTEFVVVATPSHLYVIGGGVYPQTTGLVERAEFDSSGVPTNWTTLGSLPVPLQVMGGVAYETVGGGKEIQLLGGWNWDLGSCPALSVVWKTEILPNGDLGPWWPTGSLPKPILGSLSLVFDGRLYVLGGQAGPWGYGEVYINVLRNEPGWISGPVLAASPRPPATEIPPVAVSAVVPNPFRSNSTLRFRIERAERVTVSVFDTAGRLVRTLLQGVVPAGEHRITWDGQDENGRFAASGVYLFRVRTETGQLTRKALLVH